MTNFEKIKAMSIEQFVDWVLFEAHNIARQYTQSTIGLAQWLESEGADDKEQTADVAEVVHAYWEETTHITKSKRGREIHSKLYNCSNCGAPNGRKKSSYCHWCGAKMKYESEGAE